MLIPTSVITDGESQRTVHFHIIPSPLLLGTVGHHWDEKREEKQHCRRKMPHDFRKHMQIAWYTQLVKASAC